MSVSEFVLKYADARGEVHSQVAQGASAQEIRERFSRQGFLVYSVKPKTGGLSFSGEIRIPGRRRRLNLREVSDLQPAVRHADPRGPANS